MEIKVQMPYKFIPRDYQLGLWRYIRGGGKRAFVVWHRRAGKDKLMWNLLCTDACTEQTPGIYYYFFPTYKQGKKVLWDGIDMDGMKLTDHIPKEMVKRKNDTEMKIELVNGSIIQIVGTDNYDSVRGTNPRFCVFSEYAFQDKGAWETIRPILDMNGGTCIFNTTPNGKNHAWKLFKVVKTIPEWYTEILTVKDTGVLAPEDIGRIRREGTSEETIQREYYCSFDASIEGAYYAKQMTQAHEQGRVTQVPFNPMLPVYTFWDLGYDDFNCIWFMQRTGQGYSFINCYQNRREGLGHYVHILREMKEEYGYMYEKHYLPHDVENHDIGTGMTRKQTLVSLGIANDSIKTVTRPKHKEEAIEAVRSRLPMCYFDAEKCEEGVSGLLSYHAKKNEAEDVFFKSPVHNQASHFADAFSYFALGFKDRVYTPSIVGDQFVDAW